MRAVLLPFFCCALPLMSGNGTFSSTISTTQRFRSIAETASRSELYEFFREMPKGGILHLHSEYAVPPLFWFDIATDSRIVGTNQYLIKVRDDSCPDSAAKTILYVTVQQATWSKFSGCEKRNFKPLGLLSAGEKEAWLKSLDIDTPTGGRQKFFKRIVPRLDDLWQDPNLMLEVIPEIMKRAASEQVIYLELQFDPTSLHDAQGHPVAPDVFVARLKARLKEADIAGEGVEVRFQMEAYRYATDPEKEIENAFHFVDWHRDLWVGVNLLGEEGLPGGDVSRFAPALRLMRSRYDIPVSLHAGELDSPGHEVRDALRAGAARVGHAVNLISDPDTMLLMRHGSIAIETSLGSNYLLQYTPDLSKHPFPIYLRSGVPICLNTDDPGAWGENLTDEFFLAATLYHLSWDEVVALARNSIEYAFVDDDTKADLMTRLNRALMAFEARILTDSWRANLENPHIESEFARRYLQVGN